MHTTVISQSLLTHFSISAGDMAKRQANSENSTVGGRRKRDRSRNLLTLSGAAALLSLTASFAISAFNSHRKKSKNIDLQGSAVRTNLSASEILKLAGRIISKSQGVHDVVASIPVDEVTYENVAVPLADLEAQQFPLIQSCVFPKFVSTSADVRKASSEAERRIDAHTLSCRLHLLILVLVYCLSEQNCSTYLASW